MINVERIQSEIHSFIDFFSFSAASFKENSGNINPYPILMNSSPIARFCPHSQKVLKKHKYRVQEIGLSVHHTIVSTLLAFERYQVQIQTLASDETVEDNNVLRWFEISLKMKQSQLVRALGETVPRVRLGELSENELVVYLQDDWLFPFTMEKCEKFLLQRQEEASTHYCVVKSFY